MKLLHLFLLLVFGLTVSVQAQDIDDDMYFVSNKKKATKSTVKTQKNYTTSTFATKTDTAEDDAEANVDYHTGQLRDVDDYNRRGNKASNGQVVAKLVNDTLYVYSNDSTEQKTYVYGEEPESNGKYYEDENYYEDDYTYASRLGRYHSVLFVSPWYWDYCYGWYDPWYDPWYGWYAPYYRHGFYSWYDWGWGWHYYPTWGYAWGYSGYYHHHPVYHYHGGYYGGGVSHRPSVSKPYYYGGHRPSGTISQVGRTSGSQGNIRSDARTDVYRGGSSRGGRQPVTREGYTPRSERTSTSRSTRNATSTETSNRGFNQSSRSTDSYRSSSSSSSSSSRSSSMSSGSFGGGSRGGSFGGGGGGGFSGGGRGGGGGGVGRGGR